MSSPAAKNTDIGPGDRTKAAKLADDFMRRFCERMCDELEDNKAACDRVSEAMEVNRREIMLIKEQMQDIHDDNMAINAMLQARAGNLGRRGSQ